MPRIVGRREDGAIIVGVGGMCVVVEPAALDSDGRWTVPEDALDIGPTYQVTGEPGVEAADEAIPGGMLTAEQVEAILRWEVGFVEGVPGDPERPGLGAEAELYLRYRPETGDLYLNNAVPQAASMFAWPGADAAADELDADDTDVEDFDFPPDDPDDYTEPPLLHQLCASMAYVEDLSDDELPAAAAQDLIDRISYPATAAEFYPVLAEAVAAGALPDEIVDLTDGFDEEAILSFLARLVSELDRRRPWPDPPLVAVDPLEWPSMGSSRPIGWVDMFLDELEWAVKESFGDVPEDDLPLLVLRLRGGELVALVGDDDPDPQRFLVLLPDQDGGPDARDVIDYLARYTGLEVRADGIEELLREVDAS